MPLPKMRREGDAGIPFLDRSSYSSATVATLSVAGRIARTSAYGALRRKPTGLKSTPALQSGHHTSTIRRGHYLPAKRDGAARLAHGLADSAALTLHNIYATTSKTPGQQPSSSRNLSAHASAESSAEVATAACRPLFLGSSLQRKVFSTWQKN
ncbi:MAG TPA: hypothetical protein VE842_19060 [Pyrinomonadaceae bacterium]|nr:hypothetical protein [Pyrinomonadaceae bacterium]